MILSDTFAHTKNSLFLAWAYTATTSRKYLKDNVIKPFSSNVTKIEFLLKVSIQYQADKWWEMRKYMYQYAILQ